MKVYWRHRCTSLHRTPRTFLRCAIRRLEWVHGTGDIALIAWCSVPTITLHETTEAAESVRELIDAGGCGGRCHRQHDIVRIALTTRPAAHAAESR